MAIGNKAARVKVVKSAECLSSCNLQQVPVYSACLWHNTMNLSSPQVHYELSETFQKNWCQTSLSPSCTYAADCSWKDVIACAPVPSALHLSFFSGHHSNLPALILFTACSVSLWCRKTLVQNNQCGFEESDLCTFQQCASVHIFQLIHTCLKGLAVFPYSVLVLRKMIAQLLSYIFW